MYIICVLQVLVSVECLLQEGVRESNMLVENCRLGLYECTENV